MLHPLKNTFVSPFFSLPGPPLTLYSFDALEVYVQSQKALLARNQSDIDRLRLLREQAIANPEQFFDSFDEKVFLVHLRSPTHYNDTILGQ